MGRKDEGDSAAPSALLSFRGGGIGPRGLLSSNVKHHKEALCNFAERPCPFDSRPRAAIVRNLTPGNAGVRGCVRPARQGLPGQQQ